MKKTEFTLTEEQFIMLQHFLPKKYFLKKDLSIPQPSSNSRPATRSPNHMSFTSNESPLPEIQIKPSRNELSKQISYDQAKLLKPKQKSHLSLKTKKETLQKEKDEVRQMKKELCTMILDEIGTKKSAEIFLEPVDPVALGIPQYLTIIKKPMDLKTMRTKLNKRQYPCFDDFKQDLNQIVWNCFTFNAGNDYFIKIAKKFDQDCKNILLKHKQKIQTLSEMVEKLTKIHSKDNILELSGNTDGSFSSKPQIKMNKTLKKLKQKKDPVNRADESNDCNSDQETKNDNHKLSQTQNQRNSASSDERFNNIKNTKVQDKETAISGNISTEKNQELKNLQKDQSCQSSKQKDEKDFKVDEQRLLKLINKIKVIPKEKKGKFFKLINLSKGEQINFKSLSARDVEEIERKFDDFNKEKGSVQRN